MVFVPDRQGWEKFIEQPGTYSCSQALNKLKPIENYLRNEVIEYEKLAGLSQRDKNAKGIELLTDHKVAAFLGDAARSIAYLSAVDGAVLLNQDFAVLSFGTKLKPSDKGKTVVNVLPFEGDLRPIETLLDEVFRGTRHLSAARFVADNPAAIAFVVSQDGTITGFKVDQIESDPQTSRLLAYRNLELLF